jgi:hypothetical protein
MYPNIRYYCACYFSVVTIFSLAAQTGTRPKKEIPDIPGLSLMQSDTVAIPSAKSVRTFKYSDGRITIYDASNTGMWSTDGGRNWQKTVGEPNTITGIDFGNGEILRRERDTMPRAQGKFKVPMHRSLDNGKTYRAEEGVVDTPLAGRAGGDDGGSHMGLMFHHGMLRLKNGDLMASTFGNHVGDSILADGYPTGFGFLKYRTIVLFSSDRGRTWGDPVQVAYQTMLETTLARDLDANPGVHATTSVPAITQEGFCESALVRAPNGDIICIMRSGGRHGTGRNIFPTPLYASISSNEGRNWSPPAQIADRGVCPNAITLGNGIIVATYSRPGDWIIFSDDNGKTWKGAHQFGNGNGYNDIVAVGTDTFVVFCERRDPKGSEATTTYFTVNKR